MIIEKGFLAPCNPLVFLAGGIPALVTGRPFRPDLWVGTGRSNQVFDIFLALSPLDFVLSSNSARSVRVSL